MFETSCHCGNIRLKASKLPASLTDCNCSICRRYAALWAYYLERQVEIEIRDADSGVYAWGKKTIDYHFCPVCACCTHYSSKLENGRIRIAINARMAPAEDIAAIRVRRFDGARSWSYVDE